MVAGGSIDGYEIELATDVAFGAGLVTAAVGATTTWSPATDLAASTSAPVGARWYWHVRACGAAVCSAWSGAWWVDVGRSGHDVDGDGNADVVVGAYADGTGGAYAGAAHLYRGGSGAALGPTPDSSWWGVTDEFFGNAVATGDLDGDAMADLVVGAPSADFAAPGAGRTYVYLGGVAGPDATPDLVLDGEAAGAGFGASVAAGGDLDGDGWGDLVVGAPYHGLGGALYVFRGGPAPLDGTPDAVLLGTAAGDSLGNAVAFAGDTNADGYADVVVGVYGRSVGPTLDGIAYVLLGGSGVALDVVPDATLSSAEVEDYFAAAVGAAGDVNGDGFSDVVVGAYRGDLVACGSREGKAYVYFGGPGATVDAIEDAVLAGTSAQDEGFGAAVGSAGDVDADGFDDLIIGSPFRADPLGNSTGAAFLFRGGPGAAFDVTADAALYGGANGDAFGVAVASARDLDADGYADLLVAAHLGDAAAADGGEVHVFHGGAGAFDPAADTLLAGAAPASAFGYALAP